MLWAASEAAKMDVARAERRAKENYRFHEFRSPEAKLLTAVIASVMNLFLR
jgi:hypothetical protein